MSVRVQVILDDEQKVQIEHQARLERLSLSAWIRQAALRQLAARKREHRIDDLGAFFAEVNARPGDESEPDWEASKALLSEVSSAADTRT